MHESLSMAPPPMSSDSDDIWYQLGYALERLRSAPRDLPGLEALKQVGGASGRRRRRWRSPESRRRGGDEAPGRDRTAHHGASDVILDRLLSVGTRSLGSRLLMVLPLRKRAGFVGLLASAACGSAAAVVAEVFGAIVGPGKRLSLDTDELTVTLLAGAGRGITYAGVVEPRVPGPAFLAGVVYGTAEHYTAAWGGLPSLLGSAAPHRRVPFLAEVLEGEERDGVTFTEHLVFGVALSIFYESLRPKRGITDE